MDCALISFVGGDRRSRRRDGFGSDDRREVDNVNHDQLTVERQTMADKADPVDRERLIEEGKVDLVLSSYTITPERAKRVDFAGPYFVAHQDVKHIREMFSIYTHAF